MAKKTLIIFLTIMLFGAAKVLAVDIADIFKIYDFYSGYQNSPPDDYLYIQWGLNPNYINYETTTSASITTFSNTTCFPPNCEGVRGVIRYKLSSPAENCAATHTTTCISKITSLAEGIDNWLYGYHEYVVATSDTGITYSQARAISPGFVQKINDLRFEGVYWMEQDINYNGFYGMCQGQHSPVACESLTDNAGGHCSWQYDNGLCVSSSTIAREPVLIVPGILGTEMKKGDELLWANILSMLTSVSDSFMDPLQFKSELTPLDTELSIANLVGEPFPGWHYSDLLINEFKNQGYIENETLFTFPYDWRYGVSGKYADGSTNVDKLNQKIQEILTQTGSSKVNVIAHSTGGLLVKKYVVDNPADHHIGKAVFVGVPNLGAPKAVKVLLQGDNFNITGLNDEEIKKIAENMPVAYDLLPSRKYYDSAGSFVAIVDIGYYSGPNDTEKDLNYEETKSFLTDDHELNSTALTEAENLHTQDFDNFDLRTAGVDIYAINGCKTPTLAQLAEIKSKDIFGAYHTGYDILKEMTGDGTVTWASTDSIPVNNNNTFYLIKADHGKMLSANGSRQEIVNIISGSSLNVGDSLISYSELDADNSECQLTGHWFKLFSPVSIEIFDQNGNRSGVASDDSVQNDIPGADYEVIDDHKFVFLPTDESQAYTINLKGTGEGTFTFKDSEVDGDVIQTQIFSNIPVSPNLSGKVLLGPLGTTIVLDTNGDGTIDQTINPSSVVNAEQSQDIIPPVTKAIISGSAGQPDYYRTDVNIDLQATDPVIPGHEVETSDILKINYQLNDDSLQLIVTSDTNIIISAEGAHILKFFSIDRAGNNEQIQTINFTIDKTPPEAVIRFNPDKKDIEFTGEDNISLSTDVKITDNGDIIELEDQAGNITGILLKDKDRKTSLKAELKGIEYNGVSADMDKNKFKFAWSFNKEGLLKLLEQRVNSKKDFDINVVFSDGQTVIKGKDQTGVINQTFNGLKLLEIKTNRGNLDWDIEK